MTREQIRKIKHAESLIKTAIAQLKGVTQSMPDRGTAASAWKVDLQDWTRELSNILSSDHGECGFSVCIPKMEKAVRW